MQILITKNNISDFIKFERKSNTYGGLYEDELIDILENLRIKWNIVQVLETEKNDDRSKNYIIIIEYKT
jgi:hypothetical protein